MIGMLQRHGLAPSPPVLVAEEKKSATTGGGLLFVPVSSGNTGVYQERKTRRRVADMKNFAQSALPSRAIRLIRNGIAHNEYGIRPNADLIEDLEQEDFAESIAMVRLVLENPNPEDNDFGSFVGQIVEDMVDWDAGVWEYVDNPVGISSNPWLGLFPIAGYTIAKNPKWSGKPEDPRWAQIVDSKVHAEFLHSQIEYIMQRNRTWSSFGVSQLETVIDIMESWLGISSYQREIASNAYPPIWIYLGEDADEDQVQMVRSFFEQEMVGRGVPRVWGNTGTKPAVMNLKPAGDEGLYLRYQEMLLRAIAFSFDLKPSDFGIERDVNRSTAEVSASQSIYEARRPLALLIQKRINTRVIPRIAEVTGNPLINQLEFFWIGLDPTDDLGDAEIHVRYLKHDTVKIDEVRADLDLPPLPNQIGQMTLTAFQEWAKTDLGRSLVEELEEGALFEDEMEEEESETRFAEEEEDAMFPKLVSASRIAGISSRTAKVVFGRTYRPIRATNASGAIMG